MSKTTDNGLKRAEKTRSNRLNLSDFLCLTPFSAISWRPVLMVEETGVNRKQQ